MGRAAGLGLAVVESDPAFRQYLAALVGGTPGLSCSCACKSGREGLRSIARSEPGVVIANLFLPDMPGTEFVMELRRQFPALPAILIVPEQHDSSLLIEALEAGASAYLCQPCAADELVQAIWTVKEGGAVVANRVAKRVVDYFRARGQVVSGLTEREREVLGWLARGASQAKIAAQLGINGATVRTHVGNLLGKLGAHSAAEAVAMYLNPK